MALGKYGPQSFSFRPADATVFDLHGRPAVTYTDSTGTTTAPPLIDTRGFVEFWVEEGEYELLLSTAGDSGTVTQRIHVAPGGTDSPVPNGASVPVGVGDYLVWSAGSVDATTGSVDYSTPTDSQGTSVDVDDSTDWVNMWGYAVPTVTVAGVYTIHRGFASPTANSWADVQFWDAAGAVNLAPGGITPVGSFPNGGAGTGGSSSFTVNLPAGAHIDPGAAPSDATTLYLLIQKVG